MIARTPRMDQIEALLADDPTDTFLRYGLAMEYASAGDDATAAQKLRELIADAKYVPAYLMAGQILNRLGEGERAAEVLRAGIVQARKENNGHAAGEMEGLLAGIE